MQIVADENIPLVDEFFSHLGRVVKYPGRQLSADQVKDADILLVRSVTPVNKSLLDNSAVKFVASATIGTDHVDIDYLRQRGIGFANAPGCNAESVVNYVLSSLFHLEAKTGRALTARKIGIIGAGNVGSLLQERLLSMGLSVVINDPPRAEREGNKGENNAGNDAGQPFHSLDQLLTDCDTFCLHTPLTTTGPYPSYHLLDQSELQKLNPGSWLINAGRGGAINNRALSVILAERSDLSVILDVWENEPSVDVSLAQQVDIGTPHIAGYSLEGRMKGTEMIYQAACDYLDVAAVRVLDELIPPPVLDTVALSESLAEQESQGLQRRLVNLCYDPREDHQRLMRTLHLDPMARAREFDRLRKEYPMRREFGSLKITGITPGHKLYDALHATGFKLMGG
ncbi:4-phosphoerythronate dehydrogenase PdxB [Motiliproteus sp. MSK22-1]|uniref:4-phosphoerythronate dehydrogenase PdxB n=1 Tax=Motiliproteus sp. MSK22-1 TaxID=1897630 RepID=UPI000978B33A|nr:4-phosphoerythronate dehydrogenase PdxB [Motiliproteus sp. MSK22-1]OMH25918.1 hypothetical protein BGP75_25770 [Motiliproteus sp. MSK22-1]